MRKYHSVDVGQRSTYGVRVRVFYVLFHSVGIFKDSLCSTSIITSGLILFPSVFGVSANMLFLRYAAISILFYFAIVRPINSEPKTCSMISMRTKMESWMVKKSLVSRKNGIRRQLLSNK